MESQIVAWALLCAVCAVVAMETKNIGLFIIAMFVCLYSVLKLSGKGYVLITIAMAIKSYCIIRPYHRNIFFMPD